MKERIRIIITAAQPMTLAGIKASLKQSRNFEILGAVTKVQEFLELFKMNADMILLDIDMEHIKGEDLLESILKTRPDIKVIIFSSLSEPDIQADYMQKGARAFVTKNDSSEMLLEILRSVDENGFAFPEGIVKTALKRKNVFQRKGFSSLSKRELEVVMLLREGLKDREIGLKLNISPHTVHSHRKRIFQKTSTHNVLQLLQYLKGPGLFDGTENENKDDNLVKTNNS